MNVNTLFPVEQAIRSRRTIKKFKKDPISLGIIKELLEIASWGSES